MDVMDLGQGMLRAVEFEEIAQVGIDRMLGGMITDFVLEHEVPDLQSPHGATDRGMGQSGAEGYVLRGEFRIRIVQTLDDQILGALFRGGTSPGIDGVRLSMSYIRVTNLVTLCN
jgi:hypothetical protein